ncbi:MAG TPA: hypothetical protein VN704_13210 [Verrucomicrobiae bacterium]|nr:hypothetical protein [Verrucomicrobiae bacterium]
MNATSSIYGEILTRFNVIVGWDTGLKEIDKEVNDLFLYLNTFFYLDVLMHIFVFHIFK